ncbi:MAG: hypothetical protein K6F92_08315 [Lachnospiraceae bacterium]|nr:hypothetical protein [Lachnospiraceae bacterium]
MRKKYLMLAMALCLAVPTALTGCNDEDTSKTEEQEASKPSKKDVTKVLLGYMEESGEEVTEDDLEVEVKDTKLNDDGDKCTVTGSCKTVDGDKNVTFDYEIVFKLDDEEGTWYCKNYEKYVTLSNMEFSYDLTLPTDDELRSMLAAYEDKFTFDWETYIYYKDVADDLTLDSKSFTEGETSGTAMFSGVYTQENVTYDYTLEVGYWYPEADKAWEVSYVTVDNYEKSVEMPELNVETVQAAFDKSYSYLSLSNYVEDVYVYPDYCDMTITAVDDVQIDEMSATASVTAQIEDDTYGLITIYMDLKFTYYDYNNAWSIEETIQDSIRVEVENAPEETTEEETTEEETTEEETTEDETTDGETGTDGTHSSDEAVNDYILAMIDAYDNYFKSTAPYVAWSYVNDDEYPELLCFTNEDSDNSYILYMNPNDGELYYATLFGGITVYVNQGTGDLYSQASFYLEDETFDEGDIYFYKFTGTELLYLEDPWFYSNGDDTFTYMWVEGEYGDDGQFVNETDSSGDAVYTEVEQDEFLSKCNAIMDVSKCVMVEYYSTMEEALAAITE